MIIIVPEKSFIKRARSYVRPKDFLIADATQDAGSEISEFGNREKADEFAPTPTLVKMALDPDSSEARIKKKNLNRYLDTWLDDPGLNLRLNYFMTAIVKNWSENHEDMNIFIVLQKVPYHSYGDLLRKYICDIYGENTAMLLTKKMDRDVEADILEFQHDTEAFHELKRISKTIGKALSKSGIRKEDMYNLGYDDYDD